MQGIHMWVDVFESDKDRRCYGDKCDHTIKKGEQYVLARAGAQQVSICRDCFNAIGFKLNGGK